MDTFEKLDKVDLQILRTLQENKERILNLKSIRLWKERIYTLRHYRFM